MCKNVCAADFSLLNLPKGKSLGRSKPATSSYAQAPQHTVWDDFYYIQAGIVGRTSLGDSSTPLSLSWGVGAP
jgi:hypothetical protein